MYPESSIGKSYLDFKRVFEAYSIRFVRIQWVDYYNQVRARILPVSYFRKLLETERPNVSIAKAALGIVILQVAPGFTTVGEHAYVIDFSSFRTCTYAPGHAVFSGFFQEHLPILRQDDLTYEVPYCPRTALSRLVRYAEETLGISFLVGVETEFTLLKSTNPIVPVNHCQYATTVSVTTGTVEAMVMEEIAEALVNDGIELQMYHAEAAPGQYELSTGPMPPLMAADALVHTRETIHNIANKHGLRATFAPRLALDSCGSGCHTHVSVRDRNARPNTYGSLTPVESAFLAGLMRHLPSIIAFTLPLPASYARMADGIWSGGTWVCWGTENRETPVRLTRMHTPSSRNFEIRPVDGTSNPYLAIAGILACGTTGVRESLTLAIKDYQGEQSAASMTDAERAEMGITRRLPLNLADARRNLAADESIKELLSFELVDRYVNVNELSEKEWDRREGESEEQAVIRLVESY